MTNYPLLFLDPTSVVCSVHEGLVVLTEVSVEGNHTLYDPKTGLPIIIDAAIYAKESIMKKGRIIPPMVVYRRMYIKGYYDGTVPTGMKQGDEFSFSLTFKGKNT